MKIRGKKEVLETPVLRVFLIYQVLLYIVVLLVLAREASKVFRDGIQFLFPSVHVPAYKRSHTYKLVQNNNTDTVLQS